MVLGHTCRTRHCDARLCRGHGFDAGGHCRLRRRGAGWSGCGPRRVSGLALHAVEQSRSSEQLGKICWNGIGNRLLLAHQFVGETGGVEACALLFTAEGAEDGWCDKTQQRVGCARAEAGLLAQGARQRAEYRIAEQAAQCARALFHDGRLFTGSDHFTEFAENSRILFGEEISEDFGAAGLHDFADDTGQDRRRGRRDRPLCERRIDAERPGDLVHDDGGEVLHHQRQDIHNGLSPGLNGR